MGSSNVNGEGQNFAIKELIKRNYSEILNEVKVDVNRIDSSQFEFDKEKLKAFMDEPETSPKNVLIKRRLGRDFLDYIGGINEKDQDRGYAFAGMLQKFCQFYLSSIRNKGEVVTTKEEMVDGVLANVRHDEYFDGVKDMFFLCFHRKDISDPGALNNTLVGIVNEKIADFAAIENQKRKECLTKPKVGVYDKCSIGIKVAFSVA